MFRAWGGECQRKMNECVSKGSIATHIHVHGHTSTVTDLWVWVENVSGVKDVRGR